MVGCVALVDFGFTLDLMERGAPQVKVHTRRGERIMHWRDYRYIQRVGVRA